MNYRRSFVEKVTLVYYIITFDCATVFNFNKLSSFVGIFLKLGKSHLPCASGKEMFVTPDSILIARLLL